MSRYFSATTGGFYDSAIHSADDLPPDAVEIDQADHAALLASQATGRRIQANAEGYPEAVDPPLPSVQTLASVKRREIHAEARARRDALIHEYPAHERETWPQQAREAEAYAADPLADPPPTPLLSAIAAQRGVTLAEMVAKVQTKAAAFAAAGGAIIGAQQALEDQLQAALDAWDASDQGETAEADARAAIAAIDPADPANWPAL